MKQRFAVILITALVLLIVGCSDTKNKLVEVDISELDIPSSFNYEMSHSVNVNLQGLYRLPVTIKTKEDRILFKAQMNPATGINTKLTLPKTIQQVVVTYQMYEVTLSVTGGELNHNFTPQK